jgi:hypothetical protein
MYVSPDSCQTEIYGCLHPMTVPRTPWVAEKRETRCEQLQIDLPVYLCAKTTLDSPMPTSTGKYSLETLFEALGWSRARSRSCLPFWSRRVTPSDTIASDTRVQSSVLIEAIQMTFCGIQASRLAWHKACRTTLAGGGGGA